MGVCDRPPIHSREPVGILGWKNLTSAFSCVPWGLQTYLCPLGQAQENQLSARTEGHKEASGGHVHPTAPHTLGTESPRQLSGLRRERP